MVPEQSARRQPLVQSATKTVPACPGVPMVNGLLDLSWSEETPHMAGPQTTPAEPVKNPEPGPAPEREPPIRQPPEIEPPQHPDISPPGIHDPPMPTQPGVPGIIA